MKIGITGGSGFIGSHLARSLVKQGHDVVLISRRITAFAAELKSDPKCHILPADVGNKDSLKKAFLGCQAVAHCAGINREIGKQTYKRVHIEGTSNVVETAKESHVEKILITSFLRARPNCGSAYHESKWEAEEIVRSSGLNYTVLKSGVIYGKGDHMLDHLSHALYSFPIFGLVGLKEKNIRPNAIEDVVSIIEASLIKNELNNKTVAVLGPEEMALKKAVQRVGEVVGKHPIYIRMPVWMHYMIAWFAEKIMKVPMTSIAQVRMLSEGIVEPLPACDPLPEELQPKTLFTKGQIQKGLPPGGKFGFKDLLFCKSNNTKDNPASRNL